jgi:hypothetical protein
MSSVVQRDGDIRGNISGLAIRNGNTMLDNLAYVAHFIW